MSTSVSKSSSRPRSGTKSGRKFRRLLTILLTVACSGLVLGTIFVQGHVSGTEFAPSHFQTRSFSFYEIPWVHWQITPIHRVGLTSTTATSIRLTSLGRAPKGPPKTWHIVSLNRGISGRTPADAKLLVDQLDLTQFGKPFWDNWNKNHPALAKQLWPVVQRLAQRELYVLIPELTLIARSSAVADTPAEFQAKIDRYVIQQYRGLINDAKDAKRDDLATAFASELRSDFPTMSFPGLPVSTAADATAKSAPDTGEKTEEGTVLERIGDEETASGGESESEASAR